MYTHTHMRQPTMSNKEYMQQKEDYPSMTRTKSFVFLELGMFSVGAVAEEILLRSFRLGALA